MYWIDPKSIISSTGSITIAPTPNAATKAIEADAVVVAAVLTPVFILFSFFL